VYQVNGSRKGGFPVQIESRKSGKKVTVIRNVTGAWLCVMVLTWTGRYRVWV
jgi:hypothetical protein